MRHLCKIGLHKWEETRNEFGLVRGCIHCGKMQAEFRGYWHDMDKSWTLQKWKDIQAKHEEMKAREYEDKIHLRRLQFATTPEMMSEKCLVCGSPFSCGLSRTSHFALYPLHEHTTISTRDEYEKTTKVQPKEDIVLTENLSGKTRRRRKEQIE
jgi:hypothetical protein